MDDIRVSDKDGDGVDVFAGFGYVYIEIVPTDEFDDAGNAIYPIDFAYTVAQVDALIAALTKARNHITENL